MTYFFIGVAGTGMSALAQFLAMKGHNVSGSDRLFTMEPQHPIIKQLQAAGIQTFPQGKAPIPDNATVIISSAIEPSVPEYKQALDKKLKILHRTDLLSQIIQNYNTIAVTGTSGKSTTTGMIFHILKHNGLNPSLITGAPLIELKAKGLIGNAFAGDGNWLVFEADESDGTATKYKTNAGVILNLDLDHKKPQEIFQIFQKFADNTQTAIINASDSKLRDIHHDHKITFCLQPGGSTHKINSCQFQGSDISMDWSGLNFKINQHQAHLPIIGLHNAENALAAGAAATAANIRPSNAIAALSSFRGIFRRMQIIYRGIDFTVIDDFAHNPAKIKSAITSVQTLAPQIIAWFQPHGFSPLKLWGDALVQTLAQILRPNDIFIFSPVYYAGGTAPHDVCARDYAEKLKKSGKNAFFLRNRRQLPDFIRQLAKPPTIILLMGARDPMLDYFANYVSNYVIYFDGI